MAKEGFIRDQVASNQRDFGASGGLRRASADAGRRAAGRGRLGWRGGLRRRSRLRHEVRLRDDLCRTSRSLTDDGGGRLRDVRDGRLGRDGRLRRLRDRLFRLSATGHHEEQQTDQTGHQRRAQQRQ